MELEDKDLSFNYRSHCDPRLNYEQSLGECCACHARRLSSHELIPAIEFSQTLLS